jgi:hypothetical protein
VGPLVPCGTRAAAAHHGQMHARAILRVVCDDGPFKGVQYLDEDSGRILFVDSPLAARCVYELVERAASTPASFPHARLVEIVDVAEEQAS